MAIEQLDPVLWIVRPHQQWTRGNCSKELSSSDFVVEQGSLFLPKKSGDVYARLLSFRHAFLRRYAMLY